MTTRTCIPTLKVAAVLAALALTAGCTGTTGDGETTSPTAIPTTSAPPTATGSPTPPAEAGGATAWFVVDTRAGLRLARDDRTGETGGEDGVRAAVESMIAGPADPDYSTSWNPATEVLSVDIADGVITVDLSEDARTANVGSPGAALMIQQLVWTATEGAETPDSAVDLLIEGEPAGELWGAVTWEGPVAREDPMDVRTLVQLERPFEGEVVPAGTVTISGDAAAFEANVPWRILDAEGAEVETGFTMTSEGQTFAPFSFEVELPAGEYVVEISEDDPSDGAAGTPMTDTRSFTVE